MSERPTPETDAETMQDEYDHVDSDLGPFAPSDTVPAEFARRLERERDEAIRQRDETNRSSKYACDYNYEQKLKAERERDEAREALRKCVWWAECVSGRVTEDRESINWTGLQLARKALADIQMEAAK